MSLATTATNVHIAPETFDHAKQDAVALRRAAMKKLVDDLWRVMTSSPAVASAHSDKPCVTC